MFHLLVPYVLGQTIPTASSLLIFIISQTGSWVQLPSMIWTTISRQQQSGTSQGVIPLSCGWTRLGGTLKSQSKSLVRVTTGPTFVYRYGSAALLAFILFCRGYYRITPSRMVSHDPTYLRATPDQIKHQWIRQAILCRSSKSKHLVKTVKTKT